jgi:hypothetical protein
MNPRFFRFAAVAALGLLTAPSAFAGRIVIGFPRAY